MGIFPKNSHLFGVFLEILNGFYVKPAGKEYCLVTDC